MFDKEMRRALAQDAKKLKQLTGDDHYPDYGDPPDFAASGACAECAGLGAWMLEGKPGWVECEACGGMGEAKQQER